MSGDDRRRLDHVVLPRRLPGLALLERYFPSPADNILDAELSAFARPGDTVLDPWAGTGWTARRAIAHGMRAVAADPSPFAALAARALLLAPDPAAIDAAFAQLAASRRVDVPLRQHLEELYATRCAACRSPVVAEQFIWPRSGEAPQRKIYRCASCELSVGGPPDRSASVDETDLAKLGIEHAPATDAEAEVAPEAEEELPPAPIGLTEGEAEVSEATPSLGEPGGPPPPAPLPVDTPAPADTRWASTVLPSPAPRATEEEAAEAAHVQRLRERFPVLDGHIDLVDELVELYTARNLYALETIAGKIETEFRDGPLTAIFRLALAECLLPASRLNGYPGRVASLRITGGHVRQPASRYQREVNVWRLFEASVRAVRTAVAALGRDRRPARFAADLEELGGMSAANVLWIRARPAVVGQYLAPESVDMVIGAPGPPANVDELSFEYLATAWLLGREAAQTLRLEPLFGAPLSLSEPPEGVALRHGVASAVEALRPDGWFSLLLEAPDVDRLVAVAVAGAGAGLELVDVVHRESVRSGDAITLHFRKPSAEDRLREAVGGRPLRLGAVGDHLTYPELADVISSATGDLLRQRGEPAGLLRIVAAVLLALQRTGLLPRVAHLRGADAEATDTPGTTGRALNGGGTAALAGLLREELARDDHPLLVRSGDDERPLWWLRAPELTEAPLADRVEWATFSILSTAGKLDEASFLERIFALFPGLQAPDEELVRACLAAYATVGERGQLRSEEEHAARSADHARMISLLAEYGHRLGLRVWIAKREQERRVEGRELGDWLQDEERRVYLPLVVRAPADELGQVDLIWYRRGRLAFLFEVEWTAMVGEPVLQRGRRIETTDQQARFLVLPAERAELLRLKLERSPWLRAEMERQNWHVLKWQHFETLAARPGARLEWLEPVLGLEPLIERGGEQLTIFGE